MVLVQRNPFARLEIHKKLVYPTGHNEKLVCKNCGGTTKNGTAYSYWIESDGGSKSGYIGYFCTVSCFRDYYEVEK